MGLSMYLRAHVGFSCYSEAEIIKKLNSLFGIQTVKGHSWSDDRDEETNVDINSVYVEGIKVSIAYWRKASKLAFYQVVPDPDSQGGLKALYTLFNTLIKIILMIRARYLSDPYLSFVLASSLSSHFSEP